MDIQPRLHVQRRCDVRKLCYSRAGRRSISIKPTGPGEDVTMTHDGYMRLAIEAARSVPRRPFGTVIVRPARGEFVAVGANRCDENPILHGEIDAINRCAAAHPGIDWSELALYTTAEPCAMCLSAIVWAGIPIVY